MCGHLNLGTALSNNQQFSFIWLVIHIYPLTAAVRANDACTIIHWVSRIICTILAELFGRIAVHLASWCIHTQQPGKVIQKPRLMQLPCKWCLTHNYCYQVLHFLYEHELEYFPCRSMLMYGCSSYCGSDGNSVRGGTTLFCKYPFKTCGFALAWKPWVISNLSRLRYCS